MIISRTPFRISFAGGGSDMPAYYRDHGGAVVSASIDRYIYLSILAYFHENRFFLKYSTTELVDSVEQIQHRILREVFRAYGIRGADFNCSADVPAGTGLGSSSAFTVGLINLCNAYTNRSMTPYALAEAACHVEIECLHEPIGKQDQYASTFGGLNLITFFPDDSVTVEPVPLSDDVYDQLQRNLMMFYLGQTRAARDILHEQQSNLRSDSRKVDNLQKIVQLARDLYEELSQDHIDVLGEILHAGWMYKKELAGGISNERIDHYYEIALRNGAKGGKLLGAGGCGFLLFYVPEHRQRSLRRALSDLEAFPVTFDHSGSTLFQLSGPPHKAASSARGRSAVVLPWRRQERKPYSARGAA
jgi:D-glycero-alpha-D-manno-heptose-7-phosphate kinase